MPTSSHYQRKSTHSHQHLSSLPLHQPNFNDASSINTKPFVYYLRHPAQKTWFILIVMFACTILGGHFLYTSPNVSMPFPELAIAQHYQLTPPTAATIPKIVHFVYGLKDPDPTLDVIHYFAIKSAHDRLQPDTIMFHYHYLPTGPMFEKAKPYLTLNKVDLVPTVFGRPVTHFAHQADIVRLAMLQQYGGIYLDLDVISIAPMDRLLHHEFVMGQEGIGGAVGLCNAVMLAKANARFLQRWRETYRTFNQDHWNYHSVILPGKLAKIKRFHDEITVLDQGAFFWPLWDRHGLRALFLEKSYDFSLNYATHIWESFSTVHLMSNLSLDVVRHVDNSLYCQLRMLLDQDNVRPCRWLDHSSLEHQLVGYWPLSKPNDKTLLTINPTPAIDGSGNDMHGIIQHGEFDDGGVHVTGQDSYVFLSMPNKMSMQAMTVQWQMKSVDEKHGGVAMMIQSNTHMVMAKTQADGILGIETWQLAPNGSWDSIHRTDGAKIVALDGHYHTLTLVLGEDGSNVGLYMDGKVIASLNNWIPPPPEVVVRGIWFGSAEPEWYQDPWDTRPSLAAWYRDIRVWEQPLMMDNLISTNND